MRNKRSSTTSRKSTETQSLEKWLSAKSLVAWEVCPVFSTKPQSYITLMVLLIEERIFIKWESKVPRHQVVQSHFPRVLSGSSLQENSHLTVSLKPSKRSYSREDRSLKKLKTSSRASPRTCIPWLSYQWESLLANHWVSSLRLTMMASTKANTGIQHSKMPLMSAQEFHELQLSSSIMSMETRTTSPSLMLHWIMVLTMQTCSDLRTRLSGNSWDCTSSSMRKYHLTYFISH